VVGLDANAAAMVEASRRTNVTGRGGLANAVFVVAAIETPPAELAGRASLVTVLFPWGSLLRGVVGLDDRPLAGIASLAAPGAPIEVVASVTGRDAVSAGVENGRLDDVDAIAGAWRAAGLELGDRRPATEAEVLASRSTWARRLASGGSGGPRRVICLRGRRLKVAGRERIRG
jgi:16S rRNA (adenine(1408)-N(1))-methyltransferase